MRTHDRLRIAIQKSGRLSDPARELLARAGLSFREGRDSLFCLGETLPIDLLLVRDDDIPGLIAEGIIDLGIVGLNVLEEKEAARTATGETRAARVLKRLGFGKCRLSIAVPDDWEWSGAERLAGTRIATSYPHLLDRWLRARNVAAVPVVLSGAVEIAPRLGKADAICDLVSTGRTLLANQLRETAIVLESEAVLAGPVQPFESTRASLVELLFRRFEDVLLARASQLLMFQADREALPGLLSLIPDAEPPSVMPLEGADGQVALQALCRSKLTWQRLEEMKRAGARALLVLPVEKMLS
jgi:ATP phosphoribosyltransferase